MATVSTSCNGSYGNHYTLYLSYKVNSQDINNNRSNITVEMYAQADSTSYKAYNSNATNPVKLVVDGSTKVNKKISMDFRNKKKVNMASWTGDIYHNSDGTKSIKISGEFSINGVSSLSGGSISKSGWNLGTIPRTSTISSTNCSVGQSLTINVNKSSSNFYHILEYGYTDDDNNWIWGYVIEGDHKTYSTSINWSPPSDMNTRCYKSKSKFVNFYITTYNSDGTMIGSHNENNCGSWIYMQNSSPDITNVSAYDNNSNTVSITGDSSYFIRYKSKAQVDFTVTPKYGAKISKVIVKTNNGYVETQDSSTSAKSFSINYNYTLPNNTIEIIAYDSRNNEQHYYLYLEHFIEYNNISIRSISLSRYQGTSITSLDNAMLSINGYCYYGQFKNTPNELSLTVQYRVQDTNIWNSINIVAGSITWNQTTGEFELSNYDIYSNNQIVFDENTLYEFQVLYNDLVSIYDLQGAAKALLTKATPLIDIGDDDIIVNADTRIEGNTAINGDLSVYGNGYISGNLNLGITSFLKGYDENNDLINLIRAYGGKTAIGDSTKVTGIWGSDFIIYPSSYFSSYCQFNDSVDINANLYVNNHSIRAKDIYDNNTVTNATNMYITSNGWIRRTSKTSSQVYKKDIKDIQKDELNPENLYNLDVKQFKYKDQYQPNEKDSRYNKELIGFIAEDLEKIYPIAVDYTEDGQVDNWNERYIIPAMLKLIQNQKKEIDSLKERLDKLEKGSKN